MDDDGLTARIEEAVGGGEAEIEGVAEQNLEARHR